MSPNLNPAHMVERLENDKCTLYTLQFDFEGFANKLKKSRPESAFVSGCTIVFNILVAFEVFHYTNHKNAKKRGSMDIKLI